MTTSDSIRGATRRISTVPELLGRDGKRLDGSPWKP